MTVTYVLIGAGVLFALLFLLFWMTSKKVKGLRNVKGKEERERRVRLSKMKSMYQWGWVISLAVVLITGVIAAASNGTTTGDTEFEHAHGLGYSADGNRILVPVHNGMMVYEGGKWNQAAGPKHDYMGFTPVDQGFYSSGHPAPGSTLKNPLGIVKSADESGNLETLAFAGESDFHLMTVGFKSHAIYVFNQQPNSKMESTGLFYSTDDAKTWKRADMKGIDQEFSAIAAHPTEPGTVAVGTPQGVFVSKDFGQNFEQSVPDLNVSSLAFGQDGVLYAGGYRTKNVLLQVDIASKSAQELTIPDLAEDNFPMYTAQNPLKANELVFLTNQLDVYQSKDQGASWSKIADQGKGI